MSQDLFDKCTEIVALRKRPLLLLFMPTLTRFEVLLGCDALKGKTCAEMDVVLQTPGGDPDAAYLLTKILRKHAGKLSFLIPVFAKSAGTLMCLGADELLVTEISELGPLDTQMREEREGSSSEFSSALNGFKALEQIQLHTLQTLEMAARMIRRHNMRLADVFELAIKFAGATSGTLYAQLDPKRIGEYARALDVGEKYGIMILTRYMGWTKEKATQLVRKLVKDYPSHDFVIDHDEMSEIGLPIKIADGKTEELMNELRDICIQLEDDGDSHVKLFEPPAAAPPPPPAPPASAPKP